MDGRKDRRHPKGHSDGRRFSRFNTEDGEWQTLDHPDQDMERHFFGQRLSGRITPEEVRGLEFYMYDKKRAPSPSRLTASKE